METSSAFETTVNVQSNQSAQLSKQLRDLIGSIREIIFEENVSDFIDTIEYNDNYIAELTAKLRDVSTRQFKQLRSTMIENDNLHSQLEVSNSNCCLLRIEVESLRASSLALRTGHPVVSIDASVDTQDLFPNICPENALTTPALCSWLLQSPSVTSGNTNGHATETELLASVKANIFSGKESEGETAVPYSANSVEHSNDSENTSVMQNQPSCEGLDDEKAGDHITDIDPAPINYVMWTEYLEECTAPPDDMRSPVIAYLLSNWTSDTNKAMYLVAWAECLGDSLPPGFPMGLQVVGLNPEVRDGFLMLIIPIMRRISKHPLRIYIRQAPSTVSPDFDNWSTGSTSSLALYDIRVKVLAESIRTSSTSSDMSISSTNVNGRNTTTAKWNPADYWKSSSVTSSATNNNNARLLDQESAQSSMTSTRNNSISERINASVDFASSDINIPGNRVPSNDAGSSSNTLFIKPALSTFTNSLLSIVPTTWAAKLGIVNESVDDSRGIVSSDALINFSSLDLYSSSSNDVLDVTSASSHLILQNNDTSSHVNSQLVYTSLSEVSNSPFKSSSTPVESSISSTRTSAGQQRADMIAAKLAALRKQS